MAKVTVETFTEVKMVETTVETRRVLLDISEKEAKLLAIIFSNIGGAANGTRDMRDALHNAGFTGPYGYGKKHFTFTPARAVNDGFAYSGSLYINSEDL